MKQKTKVSKIPLDVTEQHKPGRPRKHITIKTELQRSTKKIVKNPHTEFNDLINLAPIKRRISKDHHSVYQYCKTFKLNEGDMSAFLNKKAPITLRKLLEHANNLNLAVVVKIVKK